MSSASSGSGGGVTLVGGKVALLLDAEPSSLLLRRLKDAVFARDAVEAVFHVLSEAGLRNLPSFACVVRDGTRIRLLLRGAVTARVRSFRDEERTIHGEAVTTWAEHVIRDPREATLQTRRVGREDATLVLLFEQREASARAGRAGGDSLRRPARGPTEPARALEPLAPPGRPPEEAPVALPARGTPISWGAEPEPTRIHEVTILPEGETADAELPPPPPRRGPSPNERPPASRNPTSPPAPLAEEVSADRPTRDAEGGGSDFDFGHLLDHTEYRGVEAAAVREALIDDSDSFWAGALNGVAGGSTAADVATVGPTSAGDHDWHTVSAPLLAPPSAPQDLRSRPSIQAVLCVQGHANPPPQVVCATCRAPIVDRTVVSVERPVVGRLRFSDGMVVDLDRPLLMGRKPDHVPVEKIGDEVPTVLALPDPDNTLSRVHVEVRLEEWHVLVVDRHSANGTYVALPGEAPARLDPGTPCLVAPGAQVNLARVVSFVLEAPLE